MGVVCLGRHAQLDQPVAIKFLRRALAAKPAIVQRFLNEARALAALRSEHVVRVMDVGQLESGRPYLVMEHLEGIDLDALVERDGPLSVETALKYVLQVCEALAEAHALGIIHRDIKPENLFLWSGGPTDDIVKVLDFGLAKQLGVTKALAVTGPQDSMGSPCYMSPEQIVSPHLVDPRSDIWSLGVVLHRLLTDTLPFDGANLVEVLSHVLSAAPMPLREVRPSLDAELEGIVGRCLEKAPEARYATMTELAGALGVYLARRREGPLASRQASAPEVPLTRAISPVPDYDKIRIPGVHSRMPAFLGVVLVLVSAVIYQADRTGLLRVRDLTDGWLTAAPLGLDAPAQLAPADYEPALKVVRHVLAAEPTRDAGGNPALRAEPERDLEPHETHEPHARATTEASPVSEAERARRQAVYRDYLASEGLTPLQEVLPTLDDLPSVSDSDGP